MKQPSISKLKKKLWIPFALQIKNRDKWRCQACGVKVRGKNAQAGHIIPKSICGPDLYFEPLNVWTSCYRCNIFLGGNVAILASNVSKKLGFNVIEKLEEIRKKSKNKQWDRKWLEERIDFYKNER